MIRRWAVNIKCACWHSKINVLASKWLKPLKKNEKHEKNGRKLLILLENGHKGVHIVKNGSSQRKKDYKLLKVARYVWKGIKKGWKGVKMSENREKSGQ